MEHGPRERFDRALPNAALIERGIDDLAAGRETVASLLVSIGAPRLAEAGIAVPRAFDDPEHRLYRLLAIEWGDDAHSRYNALIRELVSFERAYPCAS